MFRPGHCISIDGHVVKCKARSIVHQVPIKIPGEVGFQSFSSSQVNFKMNTGQALGGRAGPNAYSGAVFTGRP